MLSERCEKAVVVDDVDVVNLGFDILVLLVSLSLVVLVVVAVFAP